MTDTGFSFGFSGLLDNAVRGRERVYSRIIGPDYYREVFHGVLDLGLMSDQSTSDTKITAAMLLVNGNNALIFPEGNYLEGGKPAIKGP